MKILMVPGPFCGKRRVYNSISSADRPEPAKVESMMQALAAESLGNVVKIRRGVFFYKTFPKDVDETTLAKYRISLEDFRKCFFNNDDHITETQKEYLESNHPKRNEYQALQVAEPV